MDVQTGLAVGAPVVGVIVWLIRLEGRVTTNEKLQEKLAADVAYIRDRIDAALDTRP